jgi:hypothetical protein
MSNEPSSDRPAGLFCHKCGQSLVPEHDFCPRCGTARSGATASGPSASIDGVPAASTRATRGSGRLVGLALLLGALLVVIGPILNGRTLFGLFQGVVTPSCTVGLTGAAVSVSVQGLNAQLQCDSFLTTTTNGGSWYMYSGGQSPTGAVICQLSLRGDLYTVRDQGSLNIYGSGICSNLINEANGVVQTPQPPVVESGACGLQVAGHDAIVLADAAVCSDFEAVYPPADGRWVQYTSSAPPSRDREICTVVFEGASVTVWDSGGAYYGSELCRRLKAS